jgi:hypothetical protein
MVSGFQIWINPGKIANVLEKYGSFKELTLKSF